MNGLFAPCMCCVGSSLRILDMVRVQRVRLPNLPGLPFGTSGTLWGRREVQQVYMGVATAGGVITSASPPERPSFPLERRLPCCNFWTLPHGLPPAKIRRKSS